MTGRSASPSRATRPSRILRSWPFRPVQKMSSEEPVLVGRGVLRVAARFAGEPTLERRNRMSDGRLAVARMIGGGSDARDAHLGLVELAAAVCRPENAVVRSMPSGG